MASLNMVFTVETDNVPTVSISGVDAEGRSFHNTTNPPSWGNSHPRSGSFGSNVYSLSNGTLALASTTISNIFVEYGSEGSGNYGVVTLTFEYTDQSSYGVRIQSSGGTATDLLSYSFSGDLSPNTNPYYGYIDGTLSAPASSGQTNSIVFCKFGVDDPGNKAYFTQYLGKVTESGVVKDQFKLRFYASSAPSVKWNGSDIATTPTEISGSAGYDGSYYELTVTAAPIVDSGRNYGHYCLAKIGSGSSAVDAPMYFADVSDGFYSADYDGASHPVFSVPSVGYYCWHSYRYNGALTRSSSFFVFSGTGWQALQTLPERTDVSSFSAVYGFNGEVGSDDNICCFASGTATISQKKLSISGAKISSKTYNASTVATVNLSSAVVSGIVSGDTVTVSGTGVFEDYDYGTQKNVAVTYSLSGADKDNYLPPDSETLKGNINKRRLTVTDANTMISDKYYDGTASADVSFSTFSNTMSVDVGKVSVSAIGTFVTSSSSTTGDPNVGENKPVRIVFSVGAGPNGDRSFCYAVPTTKTNLTADINARPITISNIQSQSN